MVVVAQNAKCGLARCQARRPTRCQACIPSPCNTHPLTPPEPPRSVLLPRSPGVLSYGGARTRACRDELNAMCDALPVPTPSKMVRVPGLRMVLL